MARPKQVPEPWRSFLQDNALEASGVSREGIYRLGWRERKGDPPNTRTLKPAGLRHPVMGPLGHPPYALVGILTTLDDLSLDAATGSAFLLAANQGQTTPELLTLSAAGTACNDIAELIFHATMRLIAAEETALNKFLNGQH
jgi:hypothetical protein